MLLAKIQHIEDGKLHSQELVRKDLRKRKAGQQEQRTRQASIHVQREARQPNERRRNQAYEPMQRDANPGVWCKPSRPKDAELKFGKVQWFTFQSLFNIVLFW